MLRPLASLVPLQPVRQMGWEGQASPLDDQRAGCDECDQHGREQRDQLCIASSAVLCKGASEALFVGRAGIHSSLPWPSRGSVFKRAAQSGGLRRKERFEHHVRPPAPPKPQVLSP
jgi:hypothetical protein